MTFLDFFVERRTGNLMKPGTRDVLEQNAVSKELYDALEERGVNLSGDSGGKARSGKANSETPPPTLREEMMMKLRAVMGVSSGSNSVRPNDPDATYELTNDNVKKMLAIHMRFRCGIPVIIMGETGCGKTRLIRFMCTLQVPSGENLVLMKVHGGVTIENIKSKVREACRLAVENQKQFPNVDTVLFFDEANTTSAIGLIKEVMCDGTLDGESLDSIMESEGWRPLNGDVKPRLRIIAAVNPYRKHSDKMIVRLEHAGLGYHIKASKTPDVLGSIPLRHLVYRVRPLPQSMVPLVWDFGQLKPIDEEKYIIQMVEKHAGGWSKNETDDYKIAVAKVLVKCQEFMRNQKEECSFVSLRDIERALAVMNWFFNKYTLFHDNISSTMAAPEPNSVQLDRITWSLVLALGVCYHACLQPRSRLYFRYAVGTCFRKPLLLPQGEKQMLEEIERCQLCLIKSLLDIPQNVSLNHALKENFFMMVVCIELKIPLFIVGRPGSSKSLAKRLVADTMQGTNSKSPLFNKLKQAMLLSFQCSPLATPEGIVKIFEQAAEFQKKGGQEKFVAVVVLDEVGLAEDSKQMPLKTLHPLLEDGCDGSRKAESYMKCGFIGISNWALDPAKMNRGILVQRGVPGKKELEEIAGDICRHAYPQFSDRHVVNCLLTAYLKVFHDAVRNQEFFGLRDFYSLMKMLAHFASERNELPSSQQFRHAVLRNFGGLDSDRVIELFEGHLDKWMSPTPVANESNTSDQPPCDSIGLITSALNGIGTKSSSESRYLLVLAENDTALNLLQTTLEGKQLVVIFGSKFPKDQQFIQVCLNINRIKVCMEAGKTVILLNLESLYESLYDALNQYYIQFGGNNFVDLGLGTQRVKCRVDPNFRLIIVADKNHVYKTFPIPLINRLEKHYVKMESLLDEDQEKVVRSLRLWAEDFVPISTRSSKPGSDEHSPLSKAFVGFSDDTAACIVKQVSKGEQTHGTEALLKLAKDRLLLSATPDAVIRVKQSRLSKEYNKIFHTYFSEQQHGSLVAFLQHEITSKEGDLFLQITTHYKLLSQQDIKNAEEQLKKYRFHVVTALQAVDTEVQFSKEVRHFYRPTSDDPRPSILVVQCESGHEHTELISCARYIISREYDGALENTRSLADHQDRTSADQAQRFIVVFLIQLNAKVAVRGFHGGRWICVHIDDLRCQNKSFPTILQAYDKTLGKLLQSALDSQANKDSGEHFEVYDLLDMCIHEALLRLYVSEDASRSSHEENTAVTDRLALLNELFDTKVSDPKFKEVFTRHLAATLVWADSLDAGSVNWLCSEADLHYDINRHCTFRRTFEDSIKDRIVPVFAALVAYIDTNRNLNLMNKESHPWVRQLWLVMFDRGEDFRKSMAPEISDIIAAQGKVIVPVKSKSSNGQIFEPKFPFSWMLRAELDEFLTKSASVMSKVVGELPLFKDYITEHPYRKWSDTSPGDVCDAVGAYVHDLLAMSFDWSPDEVSIMRDSIISAIGKQSCRIDLVHLEFSKHQWQYQNLHELLEPFDKELREEVLYALKGKQPDQQTDPSPTLDIIALRHLLNYLCQQMGKIETKWHSTIHRCYPVVQRLLYDSVQTENTNTNCSAFLESCRERWNVIISASLIFDFVVNRRTLQSNKQRTQSVSSSADVFPEKLVKNFVQMVEVNPNLKTLAAFKSLEEFLRSFRNAAVEYFFGVSALKESCTVCGIEGREQVLLGCLCVACRSCCNSEGNCPGCHRKIQYAPSDAERRCAVRRYWIHIRHIQQAFMHVLSDIVFADTKPAPDVEIDKHILQNYVFNQFSSRGRDPIANPTFIDNETVASSFILYQLIITRPLSQLRSSVNACLVEPKTSSTYRRFVELYEVYRRQRLALDSDQAPEYISADLENTSVEQLFKSEHTDFGEVVFTCANLRAILAHCAEDLYKSGITQSAPANQSRSVKKVLDFCNRAMTEGKCPHPWRFLAMQIINSYGIVSGAKALQEISEADCTAIAKVSFLDPYVIGWGKKKLHADTYADCRQALKDSLQCKKIGSLDLWYNNCQSEIAITVKNALPLLALCAAVAKNEQRSVSETNLAGLTQVYEWISSKLKLKGVEVVKKLSDEPPERVFFKQQRLLSALVRLLISRLWTTLLSLAQERESLFAPLSMVLTDRVSMQDLSNYVCYDKESATLSTTPVPTSSSPHVADSGQNPRLVLVIERFLLQTTLYCSDLQNGTQNVLLDLKQTICKVLQQLKDLLNRPMEDCLNLLHVVVCHMLLHRGNGQSLKWSDHLCTDKWREELRIYVIAPAVKDWSESDCLQAMLSDPAPFGPGLSVPWCTSEACSSGILCSAADQRMWVRHGIPTVSSFAAHLEMDLCAATSAADFSGVVSQPDATAFVPNCSPDKCTALKLIVRLRAQVTALQYLPDIVSLAVELQRDLGWQLRKSILDDRADKFIQKWCKDALKKKFSAFVKAWNMVHAKLARYEFWYQGKKRQLPEDVCSKQLDMNSTMQSFLFTGSLGLCPLALATYLADVQNGILEAYQRSYAEVTPEEVNLVDVKKIHVIVLAQEDDLLPMILCHQNHISETSNRSSMAYDYEGIEERVVGAFIRHKRRLVISNDKNADILPRFHFQERFQAAAHLKERVCLRAQQLRMTNELKELIRKELRGKVGDLADSLTCTETVIGFVASCKRLADVSLEDYMRNTLCMKDEFAQKLKKNVQKECHLCHIKDLWLLLSMEYSKALKRSGQVCFEGIDGRYKKEMPFEIANGFKKTLTQSHDTEIILWLLQILHDFIVLRLASEEQIRDQCELDFKPDEALFSALKTAHEKEDEYFNGVCTLPSYHQSILADKFEQVNQDDNVSGVRVCTTYHSILDNLAAKCQQVEVMHSGKVWEHLYEMSSHK